MARSDARALTISCVVAASLLACNAIVGVADVTLRPGDTTFDGSNIDGGGDPNVDGGDNSDDTGADSNVVAPPVFEVTGGNAHTCAKSVLGEVKCWGNNMFGQVGNGSASAGPVQIPVGVMALSSGVLGIGGGFNHSCAIKPDRSVVCWGDDSFGELGDGKNSAASNVPVLVPGVSKAVHVRGGVNYSCAVLQGGTVECWGENDGGQCGNGSKTSIIMPTPVSALTDATEIATGSAHACAVRRGGGVVCWGQNEHGQLGNGGVAQSSTPVPVTLTGSAVHVAAGQNFSCAMLSGGDVSCWGENDFGQLGNATSTPSTTATSTPAAVSGIGNATNITAGLFHACALLANGAVSCWGQNDYGQLGDGVRITAGAPTTTPEGVVGLTNAVGIGVILGKHECAPTQNGYLSCWGLNDNAQLGQDSEASDQLSPANAVGYP